MPRLKCPKPELLLEFVSIPRELSWTSRIRLKVHCLTCGSCQEKFSLIRTKWATLFPPETEITSSLIRVYSRLQSDETLIFKGWKLGENSSRRSSISHSLLSGGWVFRGAIGMGLSSLILFLIFTQFRPRSEERVAQVLPYTPFARIKFEDKNRVQVHYVQPELIKSIEFETTSLR